MQLVPNPQVAATQLEDGSGVLLHLDSRFYYSLNATGVVLWRDIEVVGAVRHDELVGKLVSAHDVPLETAQADVQTFVDELVAEGLLLSR